MTATLDIVHPPAPAPSPITLLIHGEEDVPDALLEQVIPLLPPPAAGGPAHAVVEYDPDVPVGTLLICYPGRHWDGDPKHRNVIAVLGEDRAHELLGEVDDHDDVAILPAALSWLRIKLNPHPTDVDGRGMWLLDAFVRREVEREAEREALNAKMEASLYDFGVDDELTDLRYAAADDLAEGLEVARRAAEIAGSAFASTDLTERLAVSGDCDALDKMVLALLLLGLRDVAVELMTAHIALAHVPPVRGQRFAVVNPEDRHHHQADAELLCDDLLDADRNRRAEAAIGTAGDGPSSAPS